MSASEPMTLAALAGLTGSEIFFWRLDRVRDRALHIMGLAVDACRAERWEAYSWLIREYRRHRLAWHNQAVAAGVLRERMCEEWNVGQDRYESYLEDCRATFGLPTRHKLAPLPGAEERKEYYLTEHDKELEEDRAKYDPYFLNDKTQAPT
jgi:hypothetical protein